MFEIISHVLVNENHIRNMKFPKNKIRPTSYQETKRKG